MNELTSQEPGSAHNQTTLALRQNNVREEPTGKGEPALGSLAAAGNGMPGGLASSIMAAVHFVKGFESDAGVVLSMLLLLQRIY